MQWIFSVVSSLYLLLRPINAQWYVVNACIVNRDRVFFSRALPFRRKPRRRRVADAGRLELQHFRTTVPYRRRRFLRRNRQYLFVQDNVGIRMEMLCNGCVGDLLAELSGREVIELLGRYICSTFVFSRRTLRREAGLVLKNVANLCRYTYLPT